jgi:hypothetical protein
MEEYMPRAKLATKRTVELDTLSIVDRLDEIRTNLRIAALACDGLEDTSTGDNEAIAAMIIGLERELETISEEIHPSIPEEEIAFIKRDAERRIAEINGATSEPQP